MLRATSSRNCSVINRVYDGKPGEQRDRPQGPLHKRLSCEKTPGDLHFLTCSIAFLLAHSNPTRESYSCMYMNRLTDDRHPDMYTQLHSEMDADIGTQTCNAALPSLAQAHSHSYTCAGTSYHGSEFPLRPKLMTPSISQKFKRNLSKQSSRGIPGPRQLQIKHPAVTQDPHDRSLHMGLGRRFPSWPCDIPVLSQRLLFSWDHEIVRTEHLFSQGSPRHTCPSSFNFHNSFSFPWPFRCPPHPLEQAGSMTGDKSKVIVS